MGNVIEMMRIYRLRASSNDFYKEYTIQAFNLQDALNKIHIVFAEDFNLNTDNIKVSMISNDLPNHVDEILELLHN